MLTRRQMLQTIGAAPAAAPLFAARRPPNIVILLADDLGYGDLAFTGAPDVKTPNLDRLASQSVTFTHAYCNGPVCSPTRAALMTGQYQQRNDMDSVIIVTERERGLKSDATLLPQVLKSAGYATGLMGKWHLGFQPKFLPTRRGFDEFKGFLAGNIDYFSHVDRRHQPDLWDGEKPMKDSRYMTDLIAEESMAFMERHAANPFFLYVAFNAVHDPFQGPKDRDTVGNFQLTDTKYRTREVMRTMIEALDQGAGRILDFMKKSRLEENTVVFFMSDNGGIPGIGRNLPYRGYKSQLWEGGIRTPFLTRWPGQFKAGATCSDPVAGFDIFPTCAQIAGARLPHGVKLDGVSLVDACYGKAPVKRPSGIYFHSGTQHALVRGNTKYLRDTEGGEHLFDLGADPGETKDLAQTNAAQLKALQDDYARWLRNIYNGNIPPEKNGPGEGGRGLQDGRGPRPDFGAPPPEPEKKGGGRGQ
jgi:arylsulfatase A-like enzyme